MTIGTAHERELLTRLRKYGHIEAADALQSCIAEVEALKHDLERQMAIGNTYVNEVERLKPYLRHTTSCLGQQDVNMDDVCRCGLDAALGSHADPTAFSPCVEIDALWQMLDMGKCGADDQRCVARWLVDLHREHAALAADAQISSG